MTKFLHCKTLILFASAAAIGASAVIWSLGTASAQGSGWGMWGPRPGWHHHWRGGPHMSPWQRHRMERHWRFMHGDIPKEYENLTNPLDYSTTVIEQGGKIYAEQCSRCHGAKGLGDGEAAKDLNPSPTLLAYLIQRPIAVDQYLMWTISDGGKAFGTDMPAFRDVLSRDDIWKVIAYMRSGFPAAKRAPKK